MNIEQLISRKDGQVRWAKVCKTGCGKFEISTTSLEVKTRNEGKEAEIEGTTGVKEVREELNERRRKKGESKRMKGEHKTDVLVVWLRTRAVYPNLCLTPNESMRGCVGQTPACHAVALRSLFVLFIYDCNPNDYRVIIH